LLLKNAISKYNINNIVLFPDTWLDIFDIERWSMIYNTEIDQVINNKNIKLFYTNSMSEAVKFSYINTWDDNICLMSCAAPSYSLWTDYEEKWSEFKKYIEQNKKENY
jgi:UDP-N-acetylmuramoylalanine--D-glutamate ligase